MRRRRALQLLALGGSAVGAGLLPPAARRTLAATFFVAGARHHRVVSPPGTGDQLTMERREWRGEVSLALLAQDGCCIGFVPRRYVERLASLEAAAVTVVAFDPHRVPWKRYEVGVWVAEEESPGGR